MPGAYTHITMANIAASRQNLEGIEGLPAATVGICGRWLRYCELGAVSPDYPYLDLLNNMIFDGSKMWADTMHHTRTGALVREAARILSGRSGAERDKGLAWLLGYTAHVVMDATIHPVINIRVGSYEENKREHRVCEMNQDVYIFQTKMNLAVKLSEHLKSGILRCGDDNRLDSAIKELWETTLRTVHREEAERNAPKIDRWHEEFAYMVDKIAEEGDWLSAISRHISRDIGFGYPAFDAIDQSYLKGLKTPHGLEMDFSDLFDLALKNVNQAWVSVAKTVLENDMAAVEAIRDWNLDTGIDDEAQVIWFWRQ
jgi:hypothetical protein